VYLTHNILPAINTPSVLTQAPANKLDTMALQIEPESAVALPQLDTTEPYLELRDRINSLCNTTVHLMENGLEKQKLTNEDTDAATKIARAYAENESATSKKVTTKRAAMLTPQAILYTSAILNEFGHAIVESSSMIRNLVMHKLIQETENVDPRIRLRALELLGKTSDVGLFVEKSEITVTHQTTDDLKKNLRSKLEKLINPEPEKIPMRSSKGEELVIDVDKELGLK